jgi:chemotaxis protein MotB
MSARAGKKIVIVKKKVAGGGGHHGGSWKVAYADFVTAMMAFFMVLWILGMDDKTKQAVEGYFANPIGYKKGFGSGSSPLSVGSMPGRMQKPPQMKMVVHMQEAQQFETMRDNIKEKLAGSDSLKKLMADVDVEVTGDGLRIELVESGPGDRFFQSGSARMKPATMLALQLIGASLADFEHPIAIEGHTDAAKFGPDGSYGNWELSADRANAARRVLETVGVGGRRIVEVRGLADTRLRVPADPLAAANRRISILLPFSRQLGSQSGQEPDTVAGGVSSGPPVVAREPATVSSRSPNDR